MSLFAYDNHPCPRGTVAFEPESGKFLYNYQPTELRSKCYFHHYYRTSDGDLVCLMGQLDSSCRGGWGRRQNESNKYGYRGYTLELWDCDHHRSIRKWTHYSRGVAVTHWKELIQDMPKLMTDVVLEVL